MHLYFWMRGINQNVEICKMFLQTQIYPFYRKNMITGEVPVGLVVQGSLRPSLFGLWEYVFPEESLAEVLTLLHVPETGEPAGYGTWANKFRMRMMRMGIGNGIKKIPKYQKVSTNKLIFQDGVAFHLLGVKYEPKKEMTWPDGLKTFQEPL